MDYEVFSFSFTAKAVRTYDLEFYFHFKSFTSVLAFPR